MVLVVVSVRLRVSRMVMRKMLLVRRWLRLYVACRKVFST